MPGMPEQFEAPTYGPELARLMRDAFDEAWLKFADDVRDAHEARNLLASAIIDGVDAGVRDRDDLAARAVATLATAINIADEEA